MKWLFENISVGDQVIINLNLLEVSHVTAAYFDVGPIRYRKRDGKGIKACSKAEPAIGEALKYAKHYQQSPDCKYSFCAICGSFA